MPLITQIHQQRCQEKNQVKVKQEAATENPLAEIPTTSAASHDKQVTLAALDNDLKRLSAIKDLPGKQALKTNELLPKYLPFVNAYLAGQEMYSNPALVYCAIWAVDTDDLETAMRLANACVAQQQLSPTHFSRDLPTLMAELIAEWAERQFKAGKSGSPYIDEVCQHLRDNTWPVTEIIVRGKAFKTAGNLAHNNGDDKEALALFVEAMESNPEKAGCKTIIKKLCDKLGEPYPDCVS
jgi:hypothetical protein